jgi:hypothetical protein
MLHVFALASTLLEATVAMLLLQDVGEDLVSLLHYQEKGQLIAVTSSGSAIILNKADSTGSTSREAAAGGQGPDAWNVFLRMKVTNAATGAGLQVGPVMRACALRTPCACLCALLQGVLLAQRTTYNMLQSEVRLPHGLPYIAHQHMVRLDICTACRCAGLDPTPWHWQAVRTQPCACCSWTQTTTTCWTCAARTLSAPVDLLLQLLTLQASLH